MNSQHHNVIRSSLWQIPLNWSILGILCVGTSNAMVVSPQPLLNWEGISLDPKYGANTHPGLIENALGIDLILDVLIKYLISILDAPLADQTHLDENSEPLSITADTLILGYPLFGLNTNLTISEIEYGLDDAYSLIDLLEKNPDDISLDEDTQFELKATSQAIIEVLENGE